MQEGRKIAIVGPGGGTRCAYGAGGFTALANEYKLKPDIIIGASGDAGTAVYYTSGQIHESEKIWTKALATSKFISYRRLLKAMNLDYLIDTIFKNQHPLDVAAFRDSDIACYIPITEKKTGKARYVSNRDSAEEPVDIFEALRATKAIPVLVPPVTIEGRKYEDGSLGAPFNDLLTKASELGANIIIGLDSRWVKRPVSVGSTADRKVHIIGNRNNPSNSLTSDPKKLKAAFDMGYSDVAGSAELRELLQPSS